MVTFSDGDDEEELQKLLTWSHSQIPLLCSLNLENQNPHGGSSSGSCSISPLKKIGHQVGNSGLESGALLILADKMAENPTTATESEIQGGSGEARGFDEMGTQRISVVSDQANGFHYAREKSDSFVVDIEGFIHSVDKDSNPSSRITLQRNLSKKGSLRGASEKRTGSSPTFSERDTSLLSAASPSPKGPGMNEAPLGAAAGAADHPANPPTHHQITITAGNMAESRWSNRRSYSFRRPPPGWAVDPRRILFFFATLSSMGTILLIYFTLSMSKTAVEDALLE
uniref:Uncharacterized protein n=1 Tax=Kalanchoe fedtschenkoi TaxID=63787 RepID=A0A7N0RF60_KALFE